ncbi:restriction endonuclease subunit S (plasmid) [Exiguobacterium acetylicum]
MKNKKPSIRFSKFDDEWSIRQLNELVDIVSGGTPDTKKNEYWGGDINWYSPTEIGKSIYVDESVKKITKLGLTKSSAKILPADKTVLFTSRAGIGDMAILKKEGATNQGFQSLIVKDITDTYFIFSIGKKIKDFALQNASGSTFLEISGKNLGKMLLHVPALDEQKKIGSFFKDLDDTISLHKQELDALKQTKQGFLQKMFPNGEETLPAIRFNSFVETWKQNEFGKVIKLVGGATPLKENKEYWVGDIVWLSSQEIKNKYVSKGTYTISEKAVKDNRTKVVPLGTPLIVTRSGILAKRFPISISSNEVAINQDIKALIFDPTKIDTEFIVAQMKAQESYILNNIVKTGTTVQSVNLPDLNRMILHIPQYEEQVKIGEFFRRMDEVIELKEQELEALKQTKQGFLQKMFV